MNKIQGDMTAMPASGLSRANDRGASIKELQDRMKLLKGQQ
jgi:hypothetical protein